MSHSAVQSTAGALGLSCPLSAQYENGGA